MRPHRAINVSAASWCRVYRSACAVLTLAAGQCVPWHYHTEISDIIRLPLRGLFWSRHGSPRTSFGSRAGVSAALAAYDRGIACAGEADGPASS